MPEATLYVFAISHYCEKARWALEYLGIPYRLHNCVPGMNRKIAKKLDTAQPPRKKIGSLPFLHADGELIAGSGAIIDWAEIHREDGTSSLAGDNPAVALELEKRLDAIAGVHVRRFYYSTALVGDSSAVRAIFTDDLPFIARWSTRLAWPKIVPLMIKGMDLGAGQGIQSRDIVLEELDWLDGLLADGRRYLTGDVFTRADLTAASLLAPLVNPANHPTYAALSIPASLEATIEGWRDRPILRWVSDVYAQQRKPAV
jgi:glutathione S-transferase